MCILCGDDDCHKGKLCNLKPYLKMPAVQDAIERVQKLDCNFTSNQFGSQQYRLFPKGGKRPAPVNGVLESFRRPKGFTCPFCKKTFRGGGQVDHKTAWRTYIQKQLELGPDAEVDLPVFVARVLASDPANLWLICSKCNARKGVKTVAAYKAMLQQQNSGSTSPRRSSHSRPRTFVTRQFSYEAQQERSDYKLRLDRQAVERAERAQRREKVRLSRFSPHNSGKSWL